MAGLARFDGCVPPGAERAGRWFAPLRAGERGYDARVRLAPILLLLASACGAASGRADSTRPGPYVFVAHLELDRDLGAVGIDDDAAKRGNRDVERHYASEADAGTHTIRV